VLVKDFIRYISGSSASFNIGSGSYSSSFDGIYNLVKKSKQIP
jgi:hypothetical protein